MIECINKKRIKVINEKVLEVKLKKIKIIFRTIKIIIKRRIVIV